MHTINQIRAHYHQGNGFKKISRLLGISRSTVKSYVSRMTALNLDISQAFSEATVKLIYSDHHVQQSEAKVDLAKRLPDICEQLCRVGVTRELLWKEYIASYQQGYSYGQFCREIKAYKAVQHATIRLDHKVGYTMQVDLYIDKCLLSKI